MLGEFLWRRKHGLQAWGGMLVFVAYASFKAYIKYALNRWYGDFYDSVQEVATEFESGDGDEWYSAKRDEVWRLLLDFVGIVAPSVAITPVARWLSSRW